MNLTPLFTGLARGAVRYRAGQRQREEIDRDEQERELRNMLEIYGEQRAREQMAGQQEDRRLSREQQRQNAEALDEYRKEQNRLRQETLNKPPAPRNIDPLSPDGLSASAKRAEAEARIRARFRPPPSSSTDQSEIRAARTGARQATTDFSSMLARRPKQSQFVDPMLRQPDAPAFDEAMGNWRADSTAKAGAVENTQRSLAELLGEEEAPSAAPPAAEDPAATAARQELSDVIEMIDGSSLPDAEKQRRKQIAMQRYQQSRRGGR
jgi:hypothetical protein